MPFRTARVLAVAAVAACLAAGAAHGQAASKLDARLRARRAAAAAPGGGFGVSGVSAGPSGTEHRVLLRVAPGASPAALA
ncbi:MAG: hypothetical protein SF051_10785, partial [Elusimicrobiota bacterium]|nr:hypothetical protein [Elusimicrobiota bacterium]